MVQCIDCIYDRATNPFFGRNNSIRMKSVQTTTAAWSPSSSPMEEAFSETVSETIVSETGAFLKRAFLKRFLKPFSKTILSETATIHSRHACCLKSGRPSIVYSVSFVSCVCVCVCVLSIHHHHRVLGGGGNMGTQNSDDTAAVTARV